MNNEKIQRWLNQMTLSEKCSLLSGSGFWHTQNIDRLGIPKLMLTDGPHGLRKQAEKEDHLGQHASIASTCFPSEAGLAASWNRDIARLQGRTIGVECRAEDVHVILGPGLNIKRSPLCGRNFEYLSEDPFLSSHLGAAYIQGAEAVGVGTSPKHFACNNQETRRLTIDSQVDDRALHEIYLASFEHAIKEGKPSTVMCAYNKINGEYGSENGFLLDEVLRNQWNWDGVVVTDWGATNDRVKGLQAAMDLEMPSSGGVNDKKVELAIEQDPSLLEALDKSVARILRLIDKTTSDLPYVESFVAEDHHQIAKRIAHESMVLLKNDDAVLPLSRSETVAVFGAFATKPRFQGGGSSHTNPTQLSDILSAMQQQSDKVCFAEGFDIYAEEVDQFALANAIELAKQSDKVVICAGLPERYETEGIDRSHLRLPNAQLYFITELCKVNPNVAVVLNNGAPVEMPFVGQVKAILEAYLPGQAGGEAISDILFGEVSPSGKLAETFPLKLEHNPSFEYFPGEQHHVAYREGIYVGYRFYQTKQMPVLFPFGHGLTYSQFEYSNLELSSHEISDQQSLTVTATITNTGSVEAKEVVQLYVADKQTSLSRPQSELKGFEKVSLAAGESTKVSFTLDKRSFAFFDSELSDWRVQSGEFEIRVAASSADTRLSQTVHVTSTTQLPLQVHGNTTFGELCAHPATSEYANELLDYFITHSGIDFNLGDNDENFATTVISFFPIKNMVLFCKEKFTEQQLSEALTRLTEMATRYQQEHA